ncbi:MAG TPA: carboxypeptidase regulatory-like domain-containing protein [Terriglobales bacterium]|nr:carboxypeptidase regulatory-like domain-containing protein [Terriglobales bacterium]
MKRLEPAGCAVRHPGGLWKFVLLTALLLIIAATSTNVFAQVASGTLSGTVLDNSGAVVANATIVLTNDASHVTRDTTSNSVGFFNFSAIPPGTYSAKVTAQGFAPIQYDNLVFSQGEHRSLPNVKLRPAGKEETVEVITSADQVPVETGEGRLTLNETMVTEIAITGRNGAELIRLMPGMGMNNGLSNKQWNSELTSTGNGPLGQFSANGTAPYGGMTMTSDGANIVDPGNQGSQISNINQDQTQEVTLLNSAYGAEFAKGPVVFQAYSKSGGKNFHGSGYLYARHDSMNAEDSYLKQSKQPKPKESYYYPGGTLSGPVIIPGTDINKNRDRLFFFVGYEYMKQSPSGTLLQTVVPTEAMRRGDFSGTNVLNGDSGKLPCDRTGWPTDSGWCSNTPAGMSVQNGMIPQALWDPNGVALMSLMPLPNQDPAAHNGYNYAYLNQPPLNRWELRTKIDFVINNNHRLSGTWTKQNEKDINNIGIWWWPSSTIPYPTSLPAQVGSNSLSVNLTSTFGPTMTNEFVFAWSKFVNPLRPSNPEAIDPSKVGFTAKGAFTPNIAPQIPNIVNWSCGNAGNNSGCFPNIYGPGFSSDFYNGAFGAAKQTPSFANNLTKVIGSHTMKFGGYWDMATNHQASGYGSWAQGMYDFDWWHNNSTYNPIADLLIGHPASYTQVSNVPTYNTRFHQYSLYAQDQWKVNRRLSLTYGLRLDHEGQWYAINDHPGFAVWDEASYSNSSTASPFSGMKWNAIDSSIPKSGFTSPVFTPAPRVGAAFDVFGNGQTVLRGGFGIYYWQFSYNDISVAAAQGMGIKNVSTGELSSLAEAANYSPGAASAFNGNQYLLKRGDDATPHTQSWNVTISQQMPLKSLLEVTYSGNRSRDMLLTGNGDQRVFFSNINKVPLGAFFGPNPVTGITYVESGDSCGAWCGVATGNVPDGNGSGQRGDYRPYRNYGQALNLVSHGSYSNYHSLQLSWRKQAGLAKFTTNYTFSKTLGIRDGQTNNGNGNGTTVYSFDLDSNYGPLAFDHTHIFNLAYVLDTPKVATSNPVLNAVLNGWELSGVTQFQSGVPLQPNTAGTFNVSFSGDRIGNTFILGTDATPLLPVLTCDPRQGLSNGQYFNPSCFTGPQQGQVGNFIWPYIKGPAYFNNDLSVYKNFKISESKSLQFRVNAFNFLNRALPQFSSDDLKLVLVGDRTVDGNMNAPITYTQTNRNFTGRATQSVGRRMMELGIKFEF